MLGYVNISGAPGIVSADSRIRETNSDLKALFARTAPNRVRMPADARAAVQLHLDPQRIPTHLQR